MLTITVNGIEEKMNIGCRTFVSLDELVKLLAVKDTAVTLNGERIRCQDFARITVNGGATITHSPL